MNNYDDWLEEVCAEIKRRFGSTVSPAQLEDALADEPRDMYENGETPKLYVEGAYLEYGEEFWVPMDL